MTSTHSPALRILLHAPTAGSLLRARNNAANVVKAASGASVQIVINADAVAAALDTPDASDAITLVCPNTLAKIGRAARTPLTVLPESAMLTIARMQADGWCYVRA